LLNSEWLSISQVKTEEAEVRLDELTPAANRRGVGQTRRRTKGCQRAVAIALRNRVRRRSSLPISAADVIPKNIIMIGSTGVGKTEIARRLARMSNSPFLKV